MRKQDNSLVLPSSRFPLRLESGMYAQEGGRWSVHVLKSLYRFQWLELGSGNMNPFFSDTQAIVRNPALKTEAATSSEALVQPTE